MKRFPFYEMEPKERISKLSDHFLHFEQESTNTLVDNQMKIYKNGLKQAATLDSSNKDVMLVLGGSLLVEVGSKDLRKIMSNTNGFNMLVKTGSVKHEVFGIIRFVN